MYLYNSWTVRSGVPSIAVQDTSSLVLVAKIYQDERGQSTNEKCEDKGIRFVCSLDSVKTRTASFNNLIGTVDYALVLHVMIQTRPARIRESLAAAWSLCVEPDRFAIRCFVVCMQVYSEYWSEPQKCEQATFNWIACSYSASSCDLNCHTY